MAKKNLWLGILAITLVFTMTAVGCDDGSTGDNNDPKGNGTQKGSYQSTDTVKKTYSLTFPGDESRATSRAVEGDRYVLIIEEIDEVSKVIINKTSEGTVSYDSDGTLIFKPDNSDLTFKVTTDDENMTAITGTITLEDGKTERGPGRLTPIEAVPDFTCFEEKDGKISIHKYKGAGGGVVIPKHINEKPVARIWKGAFYENKSVTDVTIPDSVTSIEDIAFDGCASLASVTIPDSVNSIGEQAFRKTSLASVTIPNGVKRIGGAAFRECTSLASVTIPNGITSIEGETFYYCASLTSVTIPNGVTSIGDTAFAYTGLTSVTISNSVTSIEFAAFAQCPNLTSVTIPNSVTSIGISAFAHSGLTSVTIENGVTSIGNWAFEGCTNLTSITIPNSVTSIGGWWAFEDCTNLTSITFLSENINWGEHGGNLGAAYETGGAGTYTTVAPVDNFSVWTKQ